MVSSAVTLAALLGNQYDKKKKKVPAALTAESSDGSLNSSVLWSVWGRMWMWRSGLENPVFQGCTGQQPGKEAKERPRSLLGCVARGAVVQVLGIAHRGGSRERWRAWQLCQALQGPSCSSPHRAPCASSACQRLPSASTLLWVVLLFPERAVGGSGVLLYPAFLIA